MAKVATMRNVRAANKKIRREHDRHVNKPKKRVLKLEKQITQIQTLENLLNKHTGQIAFLDRAFHVLDAQVQQLEVTVSDLKIKTLRLADMVNPQVKI